MRGGRALVTGASGFVGSALCHALVREGYRVRALLRPTSDPSRLGALDVEVVFGRLEDPASLRRATADQQLVFHNAAAVGDWGDARHFERVNVAGTRALLEACAQSGVGRVIHTSSLTVLDLGRKGGAIDERAPYAHGLNDAYSRTKRLAEIEVLRFARRERPKVVIVRPGAIWGPGDPTVFPRFERLARRGLSFTLGSGENRLVLSQLQNVVHGLLLAARSRDVEGEIFHIVDGEAISSRQLFSALSRALGFAPPRLGIPPRLAWAGALGAELSAKALPMLGPPLLTRYSVRLLSCDSVVDPRKARERLGYQPLIDFDEGVEQLARWYHQRQPLKHR